MLLELVTANILPASLEISTKSPEDLKFVAAVVKKEPVVEEVVFPEDVVASLTQATSLIRMVGISVVGFLIIFSTLIIVMIIGFKIRLKRDEIETVKLLGATNWFIRMPFLLEGIIYACTGAILGYAASFMVFWYFEPVIKANLGEAIQTILPLPIMFVSELLALELLVAILVGGLGSVIAVKRYLRI